MWHWETQPDQGHGGTKWKKHCSMELYFLRLSLYPPPSFLATIWFANLVVQIIKEQQNRTKQTVNLKIISTNTVLPTPSKPSSATCRSCSWAWPSSWCLSSALLSPSSALETNWKDLTGMDSIIWTKNYIFNFAPETSASRSISHLALHHFLLLLHSSDLEYQFLSLWILISWTLNSHS